MPHPVATTEIEIKTEAQPQTLAENEPETQLKIKTEPETESETENVAEIQAETELEAELKAELEADLMAEFETETENENESETEAYDTISKVLENIKLHVAKSENILDDARKFKWFQWLLSCNNLAQQFSNASEICADARINPRKRTASQAGLFRSEIIQAKRARIEENVEFRSKFEQRKWAQKAQIVPDLGAIKGVKVETCSVGSNTDQSCFPQEDSYWRQAFLLHECN